MRLGLLTLSLFGLLFVVATLAVAEQPSVNVPASPVLTAAADQPVVTPVRWHVYGPGPGWRGYGYSPYYAYRPRYWYGPPRYYGYSAYPYGGYAYPNGFGFQYYGPRRSFSFGY